MKRSVFVLTLLSCCLAYAELARVKQQEVYGSLTNVLSEVVYNTATSGTTASPSEHVGYIFTGWSLYPVSTNTFRSVDILGRALESASFTVYEDVVLTANYLPEGCDTDQDGLADGNEYYWFGDLSHDAATDADDDGMADAVEFEAGTNPLVANQYVAGGVESLGKSAVVDYNPDDLHYYTVRCEPSGKLFNTYSNLVESGTFVRSPSVSSGSAFAYWKLNGVRQADALGRALDSVSFRTTGGDDELVAVCETDETRRALLYWFGTTEADSTSDTDGDGVSDLVEIGAGTNPLIANAFVPGGVESLGTSAVIGYNPFNMQYYRVRCEPEGRLFNTYSNLVAAGTRVSSPSVVANSSFAYWTLNGIRQADACGRALTSVSFTTSGEPDELVAICESDETRRQLLHWFGTADIDPTRDTDGDAIPDLEELEAGTNPLFANAFVAGGVESLGMSASEWANLQIYESVAMFVTNDVSASLSRAEIGVVPYACDVDEDGLFDLVIKYADGEVLYLRNCGSAAHPIFELMDNCALLEFDWNQNDLSKLDGGTYDVPMEDGLSACYGLDNDLLVSDVHGRIWYYTASDTNRIYTLQHRIWGGTYYGFAEGLHIATVDWDDDGDLDCLCGTGDGRLFLLRNPDVGHPTSISVAKGRDSVILVWDPIVRSFIRGYRVYRDGTRIAEVPIPNFRDMNLATGQYAYKVTSVSRFYKAGNSAPIEIESDASEVVRAEVGKVAFRWGDSSGFVGAEIAVGLGVENSLNLTGDGLSLTVAYDTEALLPVRVDTSGLTEGVTFVESAADGVWTVTATGGSVAAGGGTFFRFVFKGLEETASTTVSLTAANVKSAGGTAVPVVLPGNDATVTIVSHDALGSENPTAVVPYGRGDLNGDGRLTKEDKQLMARLMNGGPNVKWSQEQLRAGDYNGNGRLDQDDYLLMNNDFRERGIK